MKAELAAGDKPAGELGSGGGGAAPGTGEQA